MESIEPMAYVAIAVLIVLGIACMSNASVDHRDENRPRRGADLRLGANQRQITRTDFQRASILAPEEWGEYHRLRKYAEANHMVICPKVHLSSLLRTVPAAPDQDLLKNFLETEVIDFLICTPDLQPLVAVQLNRKAKVEFALQNAGYRCVTFDTIDNAAITTIKRMLRS